MTVECPRCYKSRWRATGHFNQSRHGLRRAECICDACGYAFSSAIAEALTAGEHVRLTLPPLPPATAAPRLPGVRVLPPLPVSTAVPDYRQKQTGEESDT